MAKQIGFVVVGCGVIGKTHAEQVSAIEGAKLLGVVDEVPELAQKLAEQYGVPGFSRLEDALALPGVDVVTVGTPSGLHGEVAVAAARAGKHVIVEKPIEVNLTKADEMIAECRRHGVKLCVISQHRFDPATIEVKRRVTAGELGNMILGEAAVNWYRSQAYYDSGDWRGTWALDGGGALMNQSIHSIDLLQYLMGPVKSVSAHVRTASHERIEVEDVAVAVVEFVDGGVGTIVGTTAAYPGLSTRVECMGTRGTAVIERDRLTHLYIKPEEAAAGGNYGHRGAVNLAADGVVDAAGAAADPAAISQNAHRAQFLDMIEAVREGREPLVNGEEGRKPLEIILAIYRSAQTGEKVTLPL